MVVLIPSFFIYLKKSLSVIQILFSSIILFFIINAETWFFGQKFSGVEAFSINGTIGIVGIIVGIAQWKNITKSEMFLVGWYVTVFFWFAGNRL